MPEVTPPKKVEEVIPQEELNDFRSMLHSKSELEKQVGSWILNSLLAVNDYQELNKKLDEESNRLDRKYKIKERKGAINILTGQIKFKE